LNIFQQPKNQPIKKVLPFILTLISLNVICQQKSSWQIWIVPDKYTIYLKDTLHVLFGITGYGPIEPCNFKIMAYSEKETLIRYGHNAFQRSILKFFLLKELKDYLIKYKDPNSIATNLDDYSVFEKIYLVPEESEDKS
jgi:hypothetical protein